MKRAFLRVAVVRRISPRAAFWPLGHLLFIIAIAVLGLAALAFGDEHDLGYFTRRLAGPIWRHPEVTRRGLELCTTVLFGVSIAVGAHHTRGRLVIAGLAAFSFAVQYGFRLAGGRDS